MSRLRLHLVVAALLGVALSAPAGFAGDSCTAPCPKTPKSSHSVSLTTFPLPAYGALLPVSLAKAKTKRVLRVDAMITDGPYGPIVVPIALAASVSANGLPMQPSLLGGFTVEDCGAARGDPDGACTLTATWWLDIDDPANVAILTPPVVVTMTWGALVGPAVPVDVTLSARLEKK